MRKVLFGVVCVVMVTALGAAEAPRTAVDPAEPAGGWAQAGPLRIEQTVDRAAAKRALEDTHAWLMVEQVLAGIELPLTISVSAKELAEMELGACEGCAEEPQALRVGLVMPVNARASLAAPSWGSVKTTYDAGRVWSAAVRSEGAFGLRLHFERFRLPADTELYLFNEKGEVAGPYTGWGPLGTGEFWANMVTGDTVYLQLRQYGPAGPEKLRASWFDLVDVGHVADGFGRSGTNPTKAFCGFNAPCILNAECYNVTAVTDAKQAVGHMQWIKRPYIYICSGGLINSTVNPRTPYFLTANHCISRDRDASSLEVFFFFTRPCVNPVCPTPFSDPGTPSTLGATVVATNKTGDFSLLLLGESAPSGAAFLGWTSEPVAFTDGTDLYRISHPSGAPQAYSKHSVDADSFTCSSWPRGSWIYSTDLLGATEGGSSGSPVVNASGQVVGQLSGGCGYNLSDECDSGSNRTVDGAFASYYAEVAQYLGSGGPVECQDADGDGYDDAACGGTDCDDNAFGVNPGATEQCSDGVDNDCDGATDAADSDCGGSTCGLPGDACDTGADCCSGRCHPRKAICQ